VPAVCLLLFLAGVVLAAWLDPASIMAWFYGNLVGGFLGMAVAFVWKLSHDGGWFKG
jgi:hypothetical protein